ncbi:MAG: acyl dehydratase [Microbacteriaceae bacterium]|mgnify:FL=1|jgi:acyl dehydratase|nr:MaoC family dehydratase N-terminal domain-containing protein [Microthrixaceae bacterium]NLA08654.1 acyl dehydratase [Microbacteriaceae bacterium]HOA86237.1 MaoC/PaaZ C-terminal domain-containing protein [Microbacteriaceae bacterium]HPZ34063.1 MaoC/PaaZ C-terminal domain-containing protein [Microbacteriaceae bacterium]HQC92785.1 MaoC/PaaZ C-terminal domain-containing protein [Microbacteriaceae bacterium]
MSTASTPALSALQPGDVVAQRTIELSREMLVRYAGASGDFNPIHYRDDVAAQMGLPGVLAHGMLTMGLAVETVSAWLGPELQIREYGTRFTRPVVVDPVTGASVEIVAKVGAVDVDAGTARIDLTVSYEGRTVLGKAQVQVGARAPRSHG